MTGGKLVVWVVGGNAGIVQLKFSIVVITEDMNHLELITFEKNYLSPGATPSYNINSSKFDKNGLK